MQATELLREQVTRSHRFVERIMAPVTPEQAHWAPPGSLVNSLGDNYAHLLLGEDLVINGPVKGLTPLFASSWASKTGLSTLPPLPSTDTLGLPSWRAWSTQVAIDLSMLRSYAQATYAATEEYLVALSDEQLGQTVDLSWMDLGVRPVQSILSSVIVGHSYSHAREIACLKGLQGVQGYLH